MYLFKYTSTCFQRCSGLSTLCSRFSTIAGPVQPEVIEEARQKYENIVGEEAEILVRKQAAFHR